jgi:hypothetical protein
VEALIWMFYDPFAIKDNRSNPILVVTPTANIHSIGKQGLTDGYYSPFLKPWGINREALLLAQLG